MKADSAIPEYTATPYLVYSPKLSPSVSRRIDPSNDKGVDIEIRMLAEKTHDYLVLLPTYKNLQSGVQLVS